MSEGRKEPKTNLVRREYSKNQVTTEVKGGELSLPPHFLMAAFNDFYMQWVLFFFLISELLG